MPHQWAFAIAVSLMFCIPHYLWNNYYALGCAVVLLLLYWIDCARYGLRPQSPVILGTSVILFVLISFISCFWARFPAAGLRRSVFFLCGLIFAYLSAASITGARARNLLMCSLYAALVASALYGILDYLIGETLYYVPVAGSVQKRLCSTLEHGINYSEFIAMVLPLCLVWILRQPQKRRLPMILGLIPVVCALLLTYARTGWLALGCSLLILLLCCRPKLFLPAALVACTAVFLLPASLRSRFLSILSFSNAASSGRFLLWKECLPILKDSFLFGIGPGQENFYYAYLPHATGLLDFQPPHSNMGYLEMILSLGLPGIILFLLFFLGTPILLFRKSRHLPKETEEYGMTVSLLAVLTGAAAANLPEYLWFYPRILFLWFVLFGLARRSLSDEQKKDTA